MNIIQKFAGFGRKGDLELTLLALEVDCLNPLWELDLIFQKAHGSEVLWQRIRLAHPINFLTDHFAVTITQHALLSAKCAQVIDQQVNFF